MGLLLKDEYMEGPVLTKPMYMLPHLMPFVALIANPSVIALQLVFVMLYPLQLDIIRYFQISNWLVNCLYNVFFWQSDEVH